MNLTPFFLLDLYLFSFQTLICLFMFNPNFIIPFNSIPSPFNIHPYFWQQISKNHSQLYLNNQFINTQFIEKEKVLCKIQFDQQNQLSKMQKRKEKSQIQISLTSKNNENKKRKFIRRINNKEEQTHQHKLSQRNETKNISKNFGKAILAFAKTYTKFSQNLLKKYNVERQFLINYIKKARKDLNSLQDLRQMWGASDQKDKLKKCLRIISYNFMRRHCLTYIFNSRIKSTPAHLKYRNRLMVGMERPSQFLNIKLN